MNDKSSGKIDFGTLVAAALTAIMSGCVTPPPAGSPEESGMCHGANSCRGRAQCGGKNYACAGKNGCKGQGWIELTRANCEKAKGRFSTEFHD